MTTHRTQAPTEETVDMKVGAAEARMRVRDDYRSMIPLFPRGVSADLRARNPR